MTHCKRELFEELTKLLGELESETVGDEGFIPFVERKFFVMPWNSRRVRTAREKIPAALARLRELSGLLSAELESPVPAPSAAPDGAVYPVREGESLGAYAARVGLPEDSVLRPRTVTVYEPAEMDEGAEYALDLIEREARDGTGAPALTRDEAARFGDHMARAWDRAYASPRQRLESFGWRMDDDGPELLPGAPPAPPPPPPPAPAPEPPPPPPPAPEPKPAPEPAPPSPPRVIGGPSVELIDFGKLNRANDGAWDARVSAAPADLRARGAYVATAKLVMDFSQLPNPKSAAKLLGRTAKDFDEATAYPAARIASFVEKVAAVPGTPLQVIPDELPEPIAFRADGTRYVLFAAANDPNHRVMVKADLFVFVRGFLTGRKLTWSVVRLPKWQGIVARLEKDPSHVVALVTSADVKLDPEAIRTLIAQRMSGTFAKE